MTSAPQPLNALHAERDPGAAAALAAEALRAVNHLTLAAPSAGVPSWEYVGDLYWVLGEMSLLTERLAKRSRRV